MRLREGAAVAALMMAGCSGGGGSTPQPAPSSTPTPAPTSTPTPPPSYTTYEALAGDQSFQSACTGYIFQGGLPVALPATSYGSGFLIGYAAPTQSYTVSGDGLLLSFGPGDIDPAAPATTRAYLKPVANSTPDRFSISRPAPGGTGLDYARATVIASSRLGPQRGYQCVIGVPTLTTDLPAATAGSVVYTRTTIGSNVYLRDAPQSVGAYSTAKSTVAFTADFATRRVTATLTLVGTPLAGGRPDIPLGSFTGAGVIDPVTGNFEGSWTSSDRTASGNFGGRFFGPQAREFGYAFSLSGPDTFGQYAFAATGTAFGSR